MDSFEIIKQFGIIKQDDCSMFDVRSRQGEGNDYDVKWKWNANQQDMIIHIPENKSIFIKKEQGITSIEYKITKLFVETLKDLTRKSEYFLDYKNLFEYELVSCIIKYILGEIRTSNYIFLDIIELLEKWSSETYESKNICFSVGFDMSIDQSSEVNLLSIKDDDMLKVLTNGINTMIVCNQCADVIDIINMEDGENKNENFYPISFYRVAQWTCQKKRFAFVLTQQGEILIFYNGSLVFAKRRGNWKLIYPKPLQHLLMKTQLCKNEVKKSVMDTCLDVSFRRTGACIGIIPKDEGIPICVLQESQLKTSEEPRVKALRYLIQGKKFHEINRFIRQELAAIDGAIVIDGNGDIHAIGAILDNSSCQSRSGAGGRKVAAQTLAISGCGIKVSSDGEIEAWGTDTADPHFKFLFKMA